MDVFITDQPGLTRAMLSGRLDTANVNQVEVTFTSGIVPKGQHTVVDLTQVTFVASLGIRMLLTVARELSRKGAKFVMYGPTTPVMDIIETTALSEIIPVYTTEADAIAAVGG